MSNTDDAELCKEPSDFDKGQIVIARQLGKSVSETARLVGCSRAAVVSTYRQWCEEGKAKNRRQGAGHPKLINKRGQRSPSRLNKTAVKESDANAQECKPETATPVDKQNMDIQNLEV